MGRWCEAHRERVGRPKIRHARRRRGRGRRRSCPGESGHGRLRQRVGRRVGGREARVDAVDRLISLTVGPAAGGLGLLLAAPRAAGQTEAEDEARDEERRHETQGDLGGLAHVAAHWKKLMLRSSSSSSSLLLFCSLPPLSLSLWSEAITLS
jgi:hypothetical protein